MKRTGIHAFDWRRASAAAVDVLIALVFLFSLTVTVLTVSARSTGRTAGGFTLGIVQSGSMEASGIEIGDVMSIRRQSGYAVGDVIAFYRAPDAYAGTADEAELTNARIWIHEIIDVRTDEAGRETYLTKGTSNASDDKYYVPADFVVGRGTPLPSALNGFLRFAGSQTGVVALVIVPCGLLLAYLTFVLIDECAKPKKQMLGEDGTCHEEASAI